MKAIVFFVSIMLKIAYLKKLYRSCRLNLTLQFINNNDNSSNNNKMHASN